MAIKLTCPGCRDAVEADEADRGKRIKCGTCWADVDVPPGPVKAAPIPAAKPVPAAPIPAAKPVSAAAIPTATALPTAAPAQPAAPASGTAPKQAAPVPVAAASKPVTATALPVAPVKQATPVAAKGKGKKDDEDEPKKKKRFKERDDRDDDEDDDDRRSKAKKGGGGGVLIAFICIGAVMLLGVAGGIAVIVVNSGSNAAAATTGTPPTEPTINPIVNPNIPRPNPGGDFNPNPPVGGGPDIPPPPPPAVRPKGWAEFAGGKNFRCDMPGAVAREAVKFDHATKPVSGTAFRGGDQNDAIKVTVLELALPANTSATTAAFVASAFGLPEAALKKDPNGRLVNGHPGVEYTATADGFQTAVLTVGVGGNAFLFRYQWKPNTPTADEKRDNFLASVSILLEADGPPVVRDPFGRPDPKVAKPIPRPWVALENKDGFAVELPPGAKREKHTLELDNRGGLVSGGKWTADDGDVAYHVFVHDLGPDQLDVDTRRLAGPLVHAVFPHEVNGQEEAKVDGKAATRWNIRHFHGGMTHGVSVKVGYRVFTLFCTSKQGIYGGADATMIEREDKFLNSIKVTFDPKTFNPYADDPEWVPMAKAIGFTALIPKQSSSVSDFKPFFFPEAPAGKEWKAEIDGITYQVFAVDFTPNPAVKRNQLTDKSPADLVKWFTDREKIVEGPDVKARLGNLNAEGYVLNAFGDRHTPVRFVTAGRVVYAAKVSKSDAFDKRVGDKEYADKTARFFNSFRLGEGNIAQGGGAVGPGGPAEPFGGATGDFAKVAEAKVQPFWAGVFLPQKKELLTFGVKDASAKPVRGVLRRYSVPDFKLKATYETPSPINRAVADEGRGRLYAATVREAEDARQPEKENLIATGEVQQYDLGKLTDGSVGEGEQVKPVNVLNAAATAFKVSGLECSEDGSAVYVSGVTVSGKAPRQTFRGKLMKWETATQKFATDMNTDSPVWALALSADGKKVVALERSMDAARPTGNLVVVDGPGWKRTGTVPLVGTPNDLALRNDRAAVVMSGQAKLLVGTLEGELTETNPGGEMNYVAFTPGGTKLLLSAGGQAVGLTLYEVDNAKPPKLTKTAFAGDLSGQFVISPDGKFAVMNVGVVLDLEKSKAK